MGDVFEGRADLTVLPCGAKPTWTASVDRWIDNFGLPTPKDIGPDMCLSEVTAPHPFPGPKNITKYIAYGASVLNGPTTSLAIKELGRNIGSITKSHEDINVVESVLFGTGHGRLSDDQAARALADGFRETAHPSAMLWIFLHGNDRLSIVQKATQSGLWARFIDSIIAEPGFGGFGINLKKLIGR